MSDHHSIPTPDDNTTDLDAIAWAVQEAITDTGATCTTVSEDPVIFGITTPSGLDISLTISYTDGQFRPPDA